MKNITPSYVQKITSSHVVIMPTILIKCAQNLDKVYHTFLYMLRQKYLARKTRFSTININEVY